MTVGDSHIVAVIRINAIAVSQTQIIDNTDSLNQYFLTSHQMSGPECTAGQGYLLDGQMPYIFQEQQRYSGIKISVNMPFGHLSIEYLLVAVNLAKSGDSHILGILAVYKIQRRFTIPSAITIFYSPLHLPDGRILRECFLMQRFISLWW
jgi:hypothetical protein